MYPLPLSPPGIFMKVIDSTGAIRGGYRLITEKLFANTNDSWRKAPRLDFEYQLYCAPQAQNSLQKSAKNLSFRFNSLVG